MIVHCDLVTERRSRSLQSSAEMWSEKGVVGWQRKRSLNFGQAHQCGFHYDKVCDQLKEPFG